MPSRAQDDEDEEEDGRRPDVVSLFPLHGDDDQQLIHKNHI